MQLYWSSRSPFARKVMVAAHETGLADRIEVIPIVVGMSRPSADLMRYNPLSRIPTLIRNDGAVIADSGLICEHFDLLAGGNRLVPADAAARLDMLRHHALASGLIEIAVLRRNERDRPAGSRSAPHLASFERKTAATLARFEVDAALHTAAPFDLARIALATALAYLDFRFADEPWRPVCPRLAAWFEKIAARPSMIATGHRDG